MKKHIISILFVGSVLYQGSAQDIIPLDTLNWIIEAESYVLEPYKGKETIWINLGKHWYQWAQPSYRTETIGKIMELTMIRDNNRIARYRKTN